MNRSVSVLPFDARFLTAAAAMIGLACGHFYATQPPETRQPGVSSDHNPTSGIFARNIALVSRKTFASLMSSYAGVVAGRRTGGSRRL